MQFLTGSESVVTESKKGKDKQSFSVLAAVKPTSVFLFTFVTQDKSKSLAARASTA